MIKFIVHLITKNPIKTILFTLILIILFIIGVTQVGLKTGNDTIVSPDTKVYQDNEDYETMFGGDTIVVLLDTKNEEHPLTVDDMKLLSDLENSLIDEEGVYTIMSPVTVIKQIAQKQYQMYNSSMNQISEGLKQASDNLTLLSSQIPENSINPEELSSQLTTISTNLSNLSSEVSSIDDTGYYANQLTQNSMMLDQLANNLTQNTSENTATTDPMTTLKNALGNMATQLQTISTNIKTLVSYSDFVTPTIPKNQATLNRMTYQEDGSIRSTLNELIIQDRYVLFTIKLEGSVSDSTKRDLIDLIETFVDDHDVEDRTLVSGKPVLDKGIQSSMKDSMQTMMAISLVIMVIVLLLTFDTRWRLLPLLTIMIAVIGTIGLMGWLQIPITMVSMAVFPILIGLGIDYSIQFQSRYAEEMKELTNNE